MANIDPSVNADYTSWLHFLESHLNARRAAEAGVFTADLPVKATTSFDGRQTSTIHPLDNTLAYHETDYFSYTPSELYGAPSTAVLEELILAERNKATKASLALVTIWTHQLNALEAFRKYLAVKRMEKVAYVRGLQSAATHADTVATFVKAVINNQSPEVGVTVPVKRLGA